jgi:hypothetical protein
MRREYTPRLGADPARFALTTRERSALEAMADAPAEGSRQRSRSVNECSVDLMPGAA